MSVILRPANPLDAGALGAILHAFTVDTVWMPVLHSAAEAIGFCGRMIDRGWVAVAERDRRAVGFIARDGQFVHALYVADGARGQGVGRRLLDAAKARSQRLDLWTFQANDGAQRFYRREGFAEMRRTDGAVNEEGLPDIFFRWQAGRRKGVRS